MIYIQESNSMFFYLRKDSWGLITPFSFGDVQVRFPHTQLLRYILIEYCVQNPDGYSDSMSQINKVQASEAAVLG